MPNEIDLDQLERLGRVLGPAVREAIRQDLDSTKREIMEAIQHHQDDIAHRLETADAKTDTRFTRLEGRTGALERFAWKLAGALVAGEALIVVIVELVKSAFSKH